MNQLAHPIQDLSYEGILAHQFVGNAASDVCAFLQIDAFILANEDSLSVDQILALANHYGVNGMGLPPMAECDLPDFLRSIKEQ